MFWDTIDYNSQIHNVYFYVKNNTSDTIKIGRVGIGDGKIYYIGGGMGNHIIFPDSVLKIWMRPYSLEHLLYDCRNSSTISYCNFNSKCKFEYYRNDTLVKGSLSSWGTLKLGNEVENYHSTTDVKTNDTQTYKSDSVISEFNSPTQIDTNLLAPREAYFIGGDSALYAFINKNYNQELIKKIGVTGTIYAEITIDETGKVIGCQIKKSLNKELDDELKRVLFLLPKWVPGVCNPEYLLTDPYENPNYRRTFVYCKTQFIIAFKIN